MRFYFHVIVLALLVGVPLATAQTTLDIQAFRYEEKVIEGTESVERIQYPLAEKERLRHLTPTEAYASAATESRQILTGHP